MTNIWDFLLQTATVSVAAALLLLVKAIFRDKLSPRWQYGVWVLLALRLLLPAGAGRNVLLPLPLWVEQLKTAAEGHLHSAYSGVYEPVGPEHVLPLLKGAPRSLTDWLMLAYGLGVLLYLVRRLVSYVRLRRLLGRGRPISPAMEAKLAAVCGKYKLKTCRALELEGIKSAFVCGVLRPVLVLPAGEDTDEKILLHELLHLRHLDIPQGVFWCVLGALHWCNPFLRCVFARIGNDMESLCDQRVLERLEGEERRDYGRILLGMANEKYARAPGTSSLSNGGENISRRIEAIVRFKKYPQGMALVSLCIVLVLAWPLLAGTATGFEWADYFSGTPEKRLAMARVRPCATAAGALDTYAKGLITGDGVYLAAASPTEKQEELAALMGSYGYVDTGPELEYAYRDNPSVGYTVRNLTEQADGSYEGLLVINLGKLRDEKGEPVPDTGSGVVYNTSCHAAVPVLVRREGRAWVVEENGERFVTLPVPVTEAKDYEDPLPFLQVLQARGETGTVTVKVYTTCSTDNGSIDFARPDAEFDGCSCTLEIEYDCAAWGEGGGPENYVGMSTAPVEIGDKYDSATLFQTGTGDSSDGRSWINVRLPEGWNGRLRDVNKICSEDLALPAGYRVLVYWDRELAEEFTVTEEAP